MGIKLDDWIDSVHSQGRYVFTASEAATSSGLTKESARKALIRLSKRGRIIQLKEYFYVIVPLEYRAAGAPPATWYVRDLMAAMKQPYYVALLSAAAMHGSSHQQPQQFQVMTDRPIRPIRAGRAQLHFYTTKHLSAAASIEIKTPTGPVRVSMPETTAIDLVRFAKAAGHLDHVASVIRELAPAMDAKRLLAAVKAVGDVPNAQRLGYILDQLRLKPLAAPLHVWVEKRIERWQPLRPGRQSDGASENRRWRLLVNKPLEIAA
jgi:predicted transcriptional regulator of viral defense system